MSAYAERFDRETRTLWVSYDGRGDELEANLRAYAVDYVPGFHYSRIGLSYHPGLTEEGRENFRENAEIVIDLLTARRGISPAEERRFATALVVVQSYQRLHAEAVS